MCLARDKTGETEWPFMPKLRMSRIFITPVDMPAQAQAPAHRQLPTTRIMSASIMCASTIFCFRVAPNWLLIAVLDDCIPGTAGQLQLNS